MTEIKELIMIEMNERNLYVYKKDFSIKDGIITSTNVFTKVTSFEKVPNCLKYQSAPPILYDFSFQYKKDLIGTINIKEWKSYTEVNIEEFDINWEWLKYDEKHSHEKYMEWIYKLNIESEKYMTDLSKKEPQEIQNQKNTLKEKMNSLLKSLTNGKSNE